MENSTTWIQGRPQRGTSRTLAQDAIRGTMTRDVSCQVCLRGSERKAALQVGAESDEPVVFSELKVIKAYLRFTVIDESFSSLLTFPIEQEITKFLDTSPVLPELPARRALRVLFRALRFVSLSEVCASELLCFPTLLRLHSAATVPLTRQFY